MKGTGTFWFMLMDKERSTLLELLVGEEHQQGRKKEGNCCQQLMKANAIINLIVLMIASCFQFAFSQRIDGIYQGKLGNETSILEIKSSSDLVLGIVYKGTHSKWFFTANVNANGTGFDGYPTFGLSYDAFVKGTLKSDSIYLTVIAADSTHEGNYKWVSKKNPEKVAANVFRNRNNLDPRLFGEWICIGGTAPTHLNPLNWRITYLENGTILLDLDYIKTYTEKLFAQYSVKQKVVIPRIDVSWRTEDNRIIENWDTEFGASEKSMMYKIRGDTLFTTGTYTQIFIRTEKRKR